MSAADFSANSGAAGRSGWGPGDVRLSVEQDSEVQGLVSAAFVRLSQEAATSRYFPAMEQALDLIAGVETQRPGIARSLRGKMGIEERVPDFVEEALRARHVAAGLTHISLRLTSWDQRGQLKRFLGEVAPALAGGR